MISAEELLSLELFEGLSLVERQRLASKAADLFLRPGEWLIHEGDATGFFVILGGELGLSRQIGGLRKALFSYKRGGYFGEMPVLLELPSVASAHAVTACRVARFERQQLLELIQESSSASRMILDSMHHHLHRAQRHAQTAPTLRVLITGSRYDDHCYKVRSFLAANRIVYEWIDDLSEPATLSSEVSLDPCAVAPFKVLVDGQPLASVSTVRDLAEALGLQTTPTHNSYDVIIVGAGPAGMAAAVYGASEGLNVLMVERSAIGGQAGSSSRIENYLGFPAGISGDDLSQRAWKQANRFGAEIALTRTVTSLERRGEIFHVELDGGTSLTGQAVLLSMGVEWRKFSAPGVEELLGRGVFYGASRSEAFGVRGKRVVLVGGGNSAGQAAVFLSGYAAEIRILVRGSGIKLTMSKYLIDQIKSKNNIRVETFTQVHEVAGDGYLTRVTTVCSRPGEDDFTTSSEADALFIMIGGDTNTGWLPTELEQDQHGFITTGRDVTRWTLERPPLSLETSIPGLFCAGDARHGSVKRVASGVGEGSMAISFIHEYLVTRTYV